MRTLFIPLPSIGHIKPLLAIANTIKKFGGENFMIIPPSSQALIQLDIISPVLSLWHDVIMERKSRDRLPYRKQISNPEFLYRAIEFELEIVKKLQIDMIIVDSFISVPITSAILNKPWVSHLLGPSWLQPTPQFFAGQDTSKESILFQQVAHSFGVDSINPSWPNLMYSPYLNLVSGLEEFLPVLPDSRLPQETLFIGGLSCSIRPALAFKDNWTEIKKKIHNAPRPLCFITLGTLSYDLVLLKLIIQSVKKAKIKTLVISTGLIPDKNIELNEDNITTAQYFPFDEIAECIDVAIIHGGYNTILDCIYHRVPMVIFPANIGSDQIFNGKMINDLKLGIYVGADSPPDEAVSRAVLRILGDFPGYKNRLDYFSQMLRNNSEKDIILALKELHP